MTGVTEGQRVPDGGWGWIVALGSLLVAALIFGQASGFSILFSRYLLDHGASSLTTSWIFNTLMMLFIGMGLIVRPLTVEFGWRRISFFGIFLSSASLIISAFSPSPGFLFFSCSLLTGVGGGLVVTISYLIVPLYFDKNRGKATAIQMSGAGIAQMAVPPFLRYLLDEYGVTGASIIYGAVVMNAFVGAALFHPLKWHMKPAPQPAEPGEIEEVPLRQEEGEETPAVDADGVPSVNGPTEDHDLLPLEPDAGLKQQYQSCGALSHSSCHSHVSGELPWVATTGIGGSHPPQSPPGEQSLGTAALLWMTLVRVVHNIKRDIKTLKHFRALIIAFSYSLSNVTYLNFLLLVPFTMQAASFSLEDAAWCISLSGIVNIVVRIVVSSLADFEWFNQRYCIMFGLFCKMVASLVFSLCSELTLLLMAGGIFGLGLGCTICLQLIIIITYMGVDKLETVFGVSCLAMSLGFPVFGPLIGWIRDLTGNYAICLWTMAALDLTCILLWLLMPVAVVADARRFTKRYV